MNKKNFIIKFILVYCQFSTKHLVKQLSLSQFCLTFVQLSQLLTVRKDHHAT